MKKICLMLVIILSVTSAVSHGFGYLTPLGTGVKINKVQILGNGGAVVWLKENYPQNPDGCTEKYRVYIKSDISQFDAMLSVILSAHAQDKEVGFWSSGCVTNYFWGPTPTFPTIRDLWVN